MPRLKFSQRHFVVLMYRQSVDVFLLSVVGVSFLAFSGRRLLFVMYWLVAGWLPCVRTWDWPALIGVCMPSTPPSPWVVYLDSNFHEVGSVCFLVQSALALIFLLNVII